MTEKDTKENSAQPGRRKLLLALASGSGAIGLGSAPASWRKPAVASVMLPAHAQGSGCPGTVGNCQPEDFESYGPVSGAETESFTVNSVTSRLSGVSYVGGSLSGSGSVTQFYTQFDFDCGECGSPSKYRGFSGSFGNRTATYLYHGTARCGDNIVAHFEDRFSGTFTEQFSTNLTYVGTGTFGFEYCRSLYTVL